MRVISSRRAITSRARLSQVEVNVKVSPRPRTTLAVACPLRALYPAPSGSTASWLIGKVIRASLAGTGRKVRTDCLTLCRLSRTVLFTTLVGLLQLIAHRAISRKTAIVGLFNDTPEFGKFFSDCIDFLFKGFYYVIHQNLHRLLNVVQFATTGIYLRCLYFFLQLFYLLDVFPSVYVHLESSGSYGNRKDTTYQLQDFKCIHFYSSCLE